MAKWSSLKQQPSSKRFLLVPQTPAWMPGTKVWINGYGDADLLLQKYPGLPIDRQGAPRRFVCLTPVTPKVKREVKSQPVSVPPPDNRQAEEFLRSLTKPERTERTLSLRKPAKPDHTPARKKKSERGRT
jgi:hypothetical protein